MLPKETDSSKNINVQISDGPVTSENLMDSLEQTVDSPKLEQLLIETLTAAVTSSSTLTASASSAAMGLSGYNSFGSNVGNSQTDPQEMSQLLGVLEELLDGEDVMSMAALTNMASAGGNGDNMQKMVDMVDQEEQYEDDSPRKEDPEEISKMLVQQRLEEISREEQQLQRKMDFLVRRLYKLVARSTGLHVSEEIAGFLEHVVRHHKKKEKEQKEQQSMGNKFPCLTANLQGSSAMLAPPTPTTVPPLNLLSSPSINPPPQTQMSAPSTSSSSINLPDVIPIVTPPAAPSPPIVAERLKPVSITEMKTFMRRIENISAMQNTMSNKRAHALKYFSKSTTSSSSSSTNSKSESSLSNSTIPKFESFAVEQLSQISGLLHSELRLVEKKIDSDATASSSGGESADEMIAYNNQYQQPLSISKRATYKYAKDRGAVASRWCWLSTQISELEYKIRQHTDLRKHIRDTKGTLKFEQPVNGFEGQLPGSSSSTTTTTESTAPTINAFDTPAIDGDAEDDDGYVGTSRTRPFSTYGFRKRKLVQTANLHTISKKAGRPSTLKCGCQWPVLPCALCTARIDPTAPRDLPDTMPASERVALLDPGFHPVLSFPDDVSNSVHLEAIMNIPEWQSKMIRTSSKSIMKQASKYEFDKQGCIAGGSGIVGGNGTFKDDFNAKSNNKSTKNKKGNIDSLTGKRKYTKKFLKLDGILSSKLKKNKKQLKRSNLALGSAGTRKYTFKKRRKMNSVQFQDLQPLNSLSGQANGVNNGDYYENDYHSVRSRNSSPTIGNRFEKQSSMDKRQARNFDIDNIVIPYSVAASTRPELLPYKEIPTPKWRIITETEEESQLENEQEKCDQSTLTPSEYCEDICDEIIGQKHDRALLDERRKFETYLKFPLTSRSRANRRIDSRGNESSGANTPDPTSPAPVLSAADLESIPSPLDGQEFENSPSISVMQHAFNIRKERRRTVSKKDEWLELGGGRSGSASRCISPDFKETTPSFEPLLFPISDDALQNMKHNMPMDHLRLVEKYFTMPKIVEESCSSLYQQHKPKVQFSRSIPTAQQRKHKDSLSEFRDLRMPTMSSFEGITKNKNVLIPLNNLHGNLPNNIELLTDDSVFKKMLNNNTINGLNNELSDAIDDDEEDTLGDSDSETITGDEDRESSLFEPDLDDAERDDDFILDEEVRKPYKKGIKRQPVPRRMKTKD